VSARLPGPMWHRPRPRSLKLRGTLVQQQGQLQISRAEYIRAVGHPPGTLILPRERPALPATREEALSLAMNNNFNVISATFAELAARDKHRRRAWPAVAADSRSSAISVALMINRSTSRVLWSILLRS